MNKSFHQIRQVELTTNQLLLAQACVDVARAETDDYIKKLENKEIEVHPGQLDDAYRSRDDLNLLSKAFRTAMMSIENTWGEDE